MDRTVRQLASHISKKVADKLASLDDETFEKAWPDIEMIVKLGILQDDKFYTRVKDHLRWKNLSGEQTSIDAYLNRNKEKHENKIFYTSQEKLDAHFAALYAEKGIEILQMNGYLDTPLISHLEGKLENVKFQRVDGALDDLLVDSSREKSLLDTDGKSESAKIAEKVQEYLGEDQVTVEAKSLTTNDIPSLVVFDEQARRMRDTLALSNQDMPMDFLKKRTFIVNTNSPLISTIASHKDPETAKKLTRHLYHLSLLAQNELPKELIVELVTDSTNILSTLLKK